MKKVLKKLSSFILVGVCLFTITSKVSAKILTVDEVSNNFANTEFVKLAKDTLDINISSKVNTDTSTIDIYVDSKKEFSIKYGQDYLEWTFDVDEENATSVDDITKLINDFIIRSFGIQGIMESVITTSGHPGKFVNLDADYSNTYDTYGIELKYKVSDNEKKLESFKMSLDTDKMDKLIETYGTDINTIIESTKKEAQSYENNTKTTTKQEKTEKQDKLTNPKTGLPFPTTTIILALISGIIIIISVYKLKKVGTK